MSGTRWILAIWAGAALGAVLAGPAPAGSAPGPADAPSPAGPEPPGLAAMVEALASDAAGGRGAGTPELEQAGAEVEAWFRAAGLRPAGSDGYRSAFAGPHGESLFNVVGEIPGTGPEWIVVGAHYDGLGRGFPGTDFAGQILNGADDNAAGVAALVRAATAMAAAGEMARTVYVVAFSGEEIGRVGSRAFVADPPRSLEACAAMLNLDTVGRIEDDRLIVFGTATAEEFPDILRGVNYAFGFDLAFNGPGDGASDHASFFEKGVPVLHFFSGAKPEYHAPGDDPELVNIDDLGRLADFVAELGLWLAGEEEPLTFRPAGVERLQAKEGTERRRVSFGSIPDFSRESGGVLLSGVMPGSPAEAAGLRQGDLLLELGGLALDKLDDFQGALAARAPGDTVRVRFTRDGQEREATVVLAERRR